MMKNYGIFFQLTWQVDLCRKIDIGKSDILRRMGTRRSNEKSFMLEINNYQILHQPIYKQFITNDVITN